MKIAFVGYLAAGKDTLANYVARTYGIPHISTGDLIREHVRVNKLGGLDRANLQRVGNELRAKHGPEYFIRIALERAGEHAVLSGIRELPGARYFKEQGGIIIAIHAPIEKRYEYAKHRGGIDDNNTFEAFKASEALEINNTEAHRQNIADVIRCADFSLENTGTIEELFLSFDALVDRHLPQYSLNAKNLL